MYVADTGRYDNTIYNRCGRSGLVLPRISLGMWQNFGKNADYDTMKDIILTAFDHGVTYFDLANNYGPDPGQAEINFGKIFNENLKPYRDEIIIATKGEAAENILPPLSTNRSKEWALIMSIFFIITALTRTHRLRKRHFVCRILCAKANRFISE